MGDDKNKITETKREADRIAGEIGSWQRENLSFVKKSRIRAWKIVSVFAFAIGLTVATSWAVYMRIGQQSKAFSKSPLMPIIKTRGCVADGLLSGYGGDTDNLIKMINNSQCLYLHRAIETWAAPPDFDMAKANMRKIDKKGVIFGMFLAEAINPNATYVRGGKKFNFRDMCQEGSEGFWGANTCQANLNNRRYREYLKNITHEAIDMGVQNFLFGQIYFQDPKHKVSTISDILDDMRNYAEKNGKAIVIGAQTNDIDDEKYLKLFDYIEGGVGINEKGEIEDGPCFSRWWKKEGDRCWALLWNKKFSSRANDVLVHLDWSGFSWDDMSTFDQMDQKTRIKTLDNLYASFTGKDIGFMMPFLAVINDKINGCQGPQKNFYAPANIYSCKDENQINAILKKGGVMLSGNTAPVGTGQSGNIISGSNPLVENVSPINSGTASENSAKKDDARFVSQTIPEEMTVGYRYQIAVAMKNTGDSIWSKNVGYYLQPVDRPEFLPEKIELEDNDFIAPGQSKTFVFDIFAPESTGQYDLVWSMGQRGKGVFGRPSETLKISIIPE